MQKKKEESNRMGKSRDLFKKIRDTKGTFHAKMGSIKDRNGMDLTEAEDIRRDGKNTQKNCTKKIFMTQIMPANLENSAVATGLEKGSFHSNPKERQCQRMLKLLPNCTHLTG